MMLQSAKSPGLKSGTITSGYPSPSNADWLWLELELPDGRRTLDDRLSKVLGVRWNVRGALTDKAPMGLPNVMQHSHPALATISIATRVPAYNQELSTLPFPLRRSIWTVCMD